MQTLKSFLGLVSVFVALKVRSLAREGKGRKVSILLLIGLVLDKNTFCLLLQLKLLLLVMLVLIVQLGLGFGGAAGRDFVNLSNFSHPFRGLRFGGLATIQILAIVGGVVGGRRPLSIAPERLYLLFFKRSALFLILLKKKQNGHVFD